MPDSPRPPVVRTFDKIPESHIGFGDEYENLRFPRGFSISLKGQLEISAHWRSVPLGEYELAWDARSSVAIASQGRVSVVVIGRVFHLELDSASIHDVAAHLLSARLDGRPSLHRELYDLAGRYVILDQGAEGTYLQSDATGMRSIYYATDGGAASSHAKLTAELAGSLVKSTFGVQGWFAETKARAHPGRKTEYEAVSMLTPNTEVELGAGQVARIGPGPAPVVLSAREAAAEIVPLVQRQLAALVKNERVLVSLTAGLDSRTTLAMTYPFRDSITYFSYVTRRPGKASPSEPDLAFARDLCAEHGLAFKEVVVDKMLGKGALMDVVRGNSTRIHAPSIAAAYLEQLPLGAVHIRSNLYEIGRALVRNIHPGKPLAPLDASELARRVTGLVDHETHPASIDAFQDWLDVTHFSEVLDFDTFDLFYWEVLMGRWLPAVMTESDIAHDTYTVINCRRILELFLAVPLVERVEAKTFDEIISISWPELLGYPVNGKLRKA